MQTEPQKLSIKEKVGFSLGDGAANLIFQTMMLLQLSFYTDTFGLAAGAATTASGSLPQICSTLSAATI